MTVAGTRNEGPVQVPIFGGAFRLAGSRPAPTFCVVIALALAALAALPLLSLLRIAAGIAADGRSEAVA